MALAAQPMHSSRTTAVAVLPLASFLMVTFYSSEIQVRAVSGDEDKDELVLTLLQYLPSS